jgi:hypothetical protein
MASSSNSPFSKGRLMSTLTTIQHTSAVVFGSFLLVHLAAPAVAVVAPQGESLELATKTMILGRVYYQNLLTEPIIVYGAISVHVASSLLKKALQTQNLYKARKREASPVDGYTISDPNDETTATTPKAKSILPPITLQTVTGLLMIPALSIHAYLNRIAPASSSAPIKELSPSELDYTYVTYGFLTQSKAWRYITWALYAVLLGAGAAHVVNGTDKIARRSKARRDMKKTKKDGIGSVLGSTRAAVSQEDAKRRYRRKALIDGSVSFIGAAWLAAGIRRMVIEDKANFTTSWVTKRVSSLSEIV